MHICKALLLPFAFNTFISASDTPQDGSVTNLRGMEAAKLARRDVAETQRNMASCDDSIRRCLTIASWDTSSTGATAVGNCEQKAEQCLDNFVSGASDETTASSADSRNLVDYFSSKLVPDVCDLADAFVAKKSQFQSAGLLNTAHNNLVRLRSKFSSAADALIRIVSSDQKSRGTAAKSKGTACIDNALKSFP